MSDKTIAIHRDPRTMDKHASISVPIHRSSTFIFADVNQGANRFLGKESGYIYTRLGNPTTDALQLKIAALEKGEACVCTSCGMGAISSTVWTFLKAGDKLIADSALYGCTFALFMHSLTRFGVEVQLIDMSDLNQLKKALTKNTTMVYFETPCNPTLKINDIKEISKIAHSYNKKIKVVVDNTFATPYLQKPLTLGADIVVHSATKYINGHADCLAGCVIGKKDDIMQVALVGVKDCTGSVMDPGVAFLVNRGLSTLPTRMEAHCANAKKFVKYLQSSKYVKKIYYPGLNAKVAKKQMRDFGGMLSFEANLSFEKTKKFVNSLKVFTLAVSLGGFESLVEHPASMTHSTYTKEDLAKAGIPQTLIRVSVGLEDIDDLIADFEQAFKKASK